MHLDEQDDQHGCMCDRCMEEKEDLTVMVHEAMTLAHHSGMPIGSTDAAYVETIARQADVDFDEADRIVRDSLAMRVRGSPKRNSNPAYH